MSGPHWEYASIVWTDAMRKIGKTDPEYEKLSAETRTKGEQQEWPFYWWRTQTYYIWLPGAEEADIRRAWEPGVEGYKTSVLEILNELGAEGWEVATNVIRASAMGPNLGRETASLPIQTQILLKRPVS